MKKRSYYVDPKPIAATNSVLLIGSAEESTKENILKNLAATRSFKAPVFFRRCRLKNDREYNFLDSDRAECLEADLDR